MLHEETWDRIPRELDELAAATGIDQIAVADQRPLAFADGRQYAHYMAAQGYYVEVAVAEPLQVILLKVWELGEDEPTWADVERSVRPPVVFAFAADPPLQKYCESIVDELVARHRYNDHYAVQLVNRMCTDAILGLDEPMVFFRRRSPMQWRSNSPTTNRVSLKPSGIPSARELFKRLRRS